MLIVRVKLIFFLFFFFSSRRRHTRWTGDWSSDVCSSDLEKRKYRSSPKYVSLKMDRSSLYTGKPRTPESIRGALPNAGAPRSEERRVGKECRSRGSPYH